MVTHSTKRRSTPASMNLGRIMLASALSGLSVGMLNVVVNLEPSYPSISMFIVEKTGHPTLSNNF